MVKVELVYVPETGPLVQLNLSLELGATVADVLEASGILLSHPEVRALPVGIFSKQVGLDALVKSGDRIEIYRALTLDPMDKRRARVKQK